MSKKIIILSIIGVIVLAAGVVGGLWAFNNVFNKPNTTDPTVFVPDLAEDYGACDLLTKDQIKTALGAPANNLDDGFNSGRIFSQGGTKSQYCSYGLTDQTDTNNFKAEVTVYDSQTFIDETKDALADDKTMTSVTMNNHQGFYYSSSDETLKTKQFNLMFFDGLRQYNLSITQPSDTTTFDDASAQSVLTTLAGEVKLN